MYTFCQLISGVTTLHYAAVNGHLDFCRDDLADKECYGIFIVIYVHFFPLGLISKKFMRSPWLLLTKNCHQPQREEDMQSWKLHPRHF